MNLDINEFNPHIIPKTKTKEDVREILESPAEQYIESTFRDFSDTREKTESYYQGYRQFAAAHGLGVLNLNNLSKESKAYLTKKQVRINSVYEFRYFLIDEYKQKILNDNVADIDFNATDDVPI